MIRRCSPGAGHSGRAVCAEPFRVCDRQCVCERLQNV